MVSSDIKVFDTVKLYGLLRREKPGVSLAGVGVRIIEVIHQGVMRYVNL